MDYDGGHWIKLGMLKWINTLSNIVIKCLLCAWCQELYWYNREHNSSHSCEAYILMEKNRFTCVRVRVCVCMVLTVLWGWIKQSNGKEFGIKVIVLDIRYGSQGKLEHLSREAWWSEGVTFGNICRKSLQHKETVNAETLRPGMTGVLGNNKRLKDSGVKNGGQHELK